MPSQLKPVTRIAELVGLPILWAAIIYAATQMQSVGGDKHSLCGPWGCGPSIGALLTLHLGWLALLAPPLIYFPLRLQVSRKAVIRLTWLLVLVGTIGLLTIVAWQWLVWLPNAREWTRPYIWQRCGFAIATAVDFPLVQLILIGVVLRLSATCSSLFPSQTTKSLDQNHVESNIEKPSTT